MSTDRKRLVISNGDLSTPDVDIRVEKMRAAQSVQLVQMAGPPPDVPSGGPGGTRPSLRWGSLDSRVASSAPSLRR